MEILTLRAIVAEKAGEEAWEAVTAVELDDIEQQHSVIKADLLCEDRYTYVREFVQVTEKGIRIGINANRIGDPEVDRAMLMLVELEKVEPGIIIEFGEKIDVNAAQSKTG